MVFNSFCLLSLYIVTNSQAKLIGLTSESALNPLPYGLIFSYKNATGSEVYGDFIEKSTNFVDLLCQNFANFNHLDFRCFKVGCNNIDKIEKVDQYVKDKFCQKRDPSENEMEFVKLSLFSRNDDIQLALEPQIALEGRAYLRFLCKFFSSEWSNLHTWSMMDNFVDWANMEVNRGRKIFLCYGQPEHILGSTFCFQLAAMYRKNSEIGILVLENLESLAQLTTILHLKIDVNALRPMFGFWFLNCSALAAGHCRNIQYLADDSVDRVHLFIKILFMKNPITMTKSGTTPDIGPVPGPLIFLIHKTSSTSAVDHLSQKLINTLKGLTFIVMVNIDKLEVDIGELATLNDNVIKCKFRPRTVDENGETIEEELIDIDNLDQISASVIDWYNHRFDIRRLFHETKDKNLKFRAAEKTVEILEEDEMDSILLELNPKTNVDIKDQLIGIEPNNFDEFVKSRPIALIVYWLDVDLASQAVVYIVSQAFKILDSNSRKTVIGGHVPCHVWPELCINMFQLPEIRIYHGQGADYSIYNGIFDQNQIADRLIMLQETQLEEIFEEKDLKKMVELSNDRILKLSILGCFHKQENVKMDLYRKLAKDFNGQFIFKWTRDGKCLDQDVTTTDKLLIYNMEDSKFESKVLTINEYTTLDQMKSFLIQFNAVNYIIIRKMYKSFYLIISPRGENSALFAKLHLSATSEPVFVLNSFLETNLAVKILKTKDLYLTDFDFLLRYNKWNANPPSLSVICTNCTDANDYSLAMKIGDNEDQRAEEMADVTTKSWDEKEEL